MSSPLGSYKEMLHALAAWICDAKPGVFETVTVVCDSRDAARLISQSLTTTLPTQLTAGITLLTPGRWVSQLADQLEIEGVDAWREPWFPLAVASGLREVAASHPALAHHLHHTYQGRSIRAAYRVAELLRNYLDHAPSTLTQWLDGNPIDAHHNPIAEHLLWQPDLIRHLVADGLSNPLTSRAQLLDALPGMAASQVAVLPLAHPTPWIRSVIAAHPTVATWQWQQNSESTAVTIHQSHDPRRQAEVLRDELTRAVDEHPELEPRDIIVLTGTQSPVRDQLAALFYPSPDEQTHPGACLRLEVTPATARLGSVTDVVLQLMNLPFGRATSRDLVSLLTSPPLAARWGFSADWVTSIVEASNIRWGVDAQHRATFGLGNLSSQTWQRGLDRLLISIASGGHDVGLQIGGLPTISSSHTAGLGNLGEVVSRIRRFLLLAGTNHRPASWCSLVAELIDDLLATPDTGEAQQIAARLRNQGAALDSVTLEIPLADAAYLVEQILTNYPRRPVLGNGNLHVTSPGTVFPPPHSMVVILGIEDQPSKVRPDEIPMGLPDSTTHLLDDLEAACRAATSVMIVTQSWSNVGQALPEPTIIGALCRRLGTAPARISHPAQAHDPSSFDQTHASYDAQAARIAEAAQQRQHETPSEGTIEQKRRTTALSRPPSPSPRQVRQLDDVTDFLIDPAAWYVRHQLGVRFYTQSPPIEDLTIDTNALTLWQVRQKLFSQLSSGASIEAAKNQLTLSELIPVAGLDHPKLDAEAETVADLWDGTKNALNTPVTHHIIDVAGLRGAAALHGKLLIGISQSRTPISLFKAALPLWVSLVGLAAQQIPARATLSYPRRPNSSPGRFSSLELDPPAPDEAHNLLEAWRDAAQRGTEQLVPVPFEASVALMTTLDAHREPDDFTWRNQPDHHRHAWQLSKRSAAWLLFFSGPACELWETPAEAAPHLSRNHLPYGAFGAWAELLHGPMLRHRR